MTDPEPTPGLAETEIPDELPGLRLASTVVFPLDVVSVQLDRPRSQRMIGDNAGDAVVACFLPADMEDLATRIRELPALRELVRTRTAEQLIEALSAHPDAQSVCDGIRQYLDRYGHQIYNLDFVAPTQNEDPLPMLLSLKTLTNCLMKRITLQR